METNDQELQSALPPVMSKTKRILKWLGIISTGIATVLTPLIIMYVEVKPQVDEAKDEAESGYEAVVPAIVEIQSILNDAKAWAEDTDIELRTIEADQKSMEKRLARCEAYIDVLSTSRRFPRAPAPPPEDLTSRAPEPRTPDEPPVQQTAKYKLPKSIGGAKKKADARKKAGCAPGDPLCGEL